MGYIDLLLGRTPGANIARWSREADEVLDVVADALPALARHGKTLPSDPLFRTPHAREAARYAFSSADDSVDTLASHARTFSISGGAPGTVTTYPSLLSESSSTVREVDRLASNYRSLPKGIMDDVDEAADDLADGDRWLQSARYSTDINHQKTAAVHAATDFSHASRSMEDASDALHSRLAPFARYDDLRLGTTELAEEASYIASRSVDVKNVAPATHKLTKQASAATNDAERAVNAIHPGDEAEPALGVIATARETLAQAQAAGKAEPTPKHFYAKVAAAWGLTLGAIGGAVAGIMVLTRDEP